MVKLDKITTLITLGFRSSLAVYVLLNLDESE